MILLMIKNGDHAKIPAAILSTLGDWVTMFPEVLRHSLTLESYWVSAGQFWQRWYCRLKQGVSGLQEMQVIPSKKGLEAGQSETSGSAVWVLKQIVFHSLRERPSRIRFDALVGLVCMRCLLAQLQMFGSKMVGTMQLVHFIPSQEKIGFD